jgi:hypothetical protein
MSRRKGPVFAARNIEKIEAKRNNGGVSKKTKEKRLSANVIFDKAQALNERPTLKQLCDNRDKDGLESDLQGFFESYYVSLDNVDTEDQAETENQVDIEDQDDTGDQDDTEDQDDTMDQDDTEYQDDAEDQDDTEDQADAEDQDDTDDKDCRRPKKNTALAYKSHFKMLIRDFTNSEFDISNPGQFPKFNVSNLVYNVTNKKNIII